MKHPGDANAFARDPSDIRAAVLSVSSSSGFKNSPRLSAFLSYIVDETLAGRAPGIKATTIAMDVYDRAPDKDDQAANIVRVDAGRLRRLLVAYYEQDGQSDEIRIDVPKGAYIPVFARKSNSHNGPSGPEREKPNRTWLLTFLAVVVLGLAGLGAGLAIRSIETSAPDAQTAAQRSAIFEAAPNKLQAVAMVEQAKELIFPAFDPVRLSTAQTLFQRASELDPQNHEAFAGMGLTTSMAAFLSPPSVDTAALVATGLAQSQKGVDLEPQSAWAQISRAWSLFVARRTDEADDAARLARQLSPSDPRVQDFEALIYLFSGRFANTVRASDTSAQALPYSSRSPRINALGAALFHLGNYDAAIKAFKKSARAGAPVSALATAYLVASYQASNETRKARDLAKEAKLAWPDTNIRVLATQLFVNPVDLENLFHQLELAGLIAPPQN